MQKLRIIPAALLLLCLLTACGGPVESVTTAETTAELIIVTEAETRTAEESKTTEKSAQPIPNDLLDFALIDRLFSMTYADFCREEGRTVEPEGMYDGGVYCYFSKYGDDAVFFFDYAAAGIAGNDLLNVVSMKAPDLLLNRQALTLGEMKQWLNEKGIACTVSEPEDDGLRFFFELGKYEFRGNLDSKKDSAPIGGFQVYCKSNYDSHLT